MIEKKSKTKFKPKTSVPIVLEKTEPGERIDLEKEEAETPKIEITKVWNAPRKEWTVGLARVCTNCGRKEYWGYELCSVKGSPQKMEMVCFHCLHHSGYERIPGRGGWSWSKDNVLIPNQA